MNDDCVFCKIIRGELPAYKIYENDIVLVIMDNANDVDGHMLVLPKQHFENIYDVDKNTLCEIMTAIQKLGLHLQKLNYEGLNILNANGEVAGQSVKHLHFHIIPRRKDDGIYAWPKFDGALNNIEDMWAKLKM